MNLKDWIIRILVAFAVMIAIALVIIIPMTASAVEIEDYNDGDRWTEPPVVVLSTCPVQPCRLTGEQINDILEGTGLSGLGETYAAGEEETGINALFVISITALESGWGDSYNARERNNLGGIKGADGYRAFDSREDSIRDMYDFLDRLYIKQGRTTIAEIGAKYCESAGWAGQVERIMRDLIDQAAGYMEQEE
jgi:beta-N-acetylglucosaminidase